MDRHDDVSCQAYVEACRSKSGTGFEKDDGGYNSSFEVDTKAIRAGW